MGDKVSVCVCVCVCVCVHRRGSMSLSLDLRTPPLLNPTRTNENEPTMLDAPITTLVVYAGDYALSKLKGTQAGATPMALYLAVPSQLPGRLPWLAPPRNVEKVGDARCTHTHKCAHTHTHTHMHVMLPCHGCTLGIVCPKAAALTGACGMHAMYKPTCNWVLLFACVCMCMCMCVCVCVAACPGHPLSTRWQCDNRLPVRVWRLSSAHRSAC